MLFSAVVKQMVGLKRGTRYYYCYCCYVTVIGIVVIIVTVILIAIVIVIDHFRVTLQFPRTITLKSRLRSRKYSKCMKTWHEASTSGYCSRELTQNRNSPRGGGGTPISKGRGCSSGNFIWTPKRYQSGCGLSRILPLKVTNQKQRDKQFVSMNLTCLIA